MKKKHVKFLKQLLETPSVTGTEMAVANLVRNRLANVADEIRTDTMGSVHARLAGSGNGPSFMLAAHMDEIGLMVTYISDEGFLSVAAVGGVDAAILPGQRVNVYATGCDKPLRGVVGRKPIHLISPDERKKVTPLDSLVIDLGLSGDAVKELVRVGDVITFGVGFERFGNNMAVSRAFDDKAGVWIVIQTLKKLAKAGGTSGDVYAVATVQEEIGTRGAITSAYGVDPDVAVAFDVTHATDYPGIEKAEYGDIVCGGGPVIARGPNINPEVFTRLVSAAEAEGIPYQLEAEPSVTGTDARSIQVARGGIPTGLVSIPLRYMHTPTEVVCLEDLEATVRLFVRFAQDLDEDACFVPGMAYENVKEGEDSMANEEDMNGESGSCAVPETSDEEIPADVIEALTEIAETGQLEEIGAAIQHIQAVNERRRAVDEALAAAEAEESAEAVEELEIAEAVAEAEAEAESEVNQDTVEEVVVVEIEETDDTN